MRPKRCLHALKTARRRAIHLTRAANGGGGKIHTPPSEGSITTTTTTTDHSRQVDDRLCALGLRPRTTPIHSELSAEEAVRIIDAWERDVASAPNSDPVGVGALLHRLKNGITTPDMDAVRARARRERYFPDEYADIIIG